MGSNIDAGGEPATHLTGAERTSIRTDHGIEGSEFGRNTRTEVVIRAHGHWPVVSLREWWEFREVLHFLIWRDIAVRYKQTILGASWAVVQPVCAMIVFTLFFSGLSNMSSEGLPYPLFSYAGLLPWTFFANGLTHASNSLVENRHLLTKVYFPRVLLPLSVIVAGLIDLALAMLVLFGMMFYYRQPPSVQSLSAILFIILAFISALGVGMWLAALNAQFRDVRYITPFLTQLWLFSTPVIYPSSILPERWKLIYGLNPMVGVVEGFRWSLFDTQGFTFQSVYMSVAVSLLLFISGALYFAHIDKVVADVV